MSALSLAAPRKSPEGYKRTRRAYSASRAWDTLRINDPESGRIVDGIEVNQCCRRSKG